jgi:predicted nucleic acid-binding protein
MELPTSLIDAEMTIVADASAIINLNASGCARDIIRALPNRFVVVTDVADELEDGRRRGRQDADMLEALVKDRAVEIVELDEDSGAHFERLVVGPAATTLDDGEAATIAYAVTHQGLVVIDESKATRLCTRLYPKLPVGCTVDILAHSRVMKALGRDRLADAVYNALREGRMRVFEKHTRWVLDLIGPERAAECPSLPKHARQPESNVAAGDVRSSNDAI